MMHSDENICKFYTFSGQLACVCVLCVCLCVYICLCFGFVVLFFKEGKRWNWVHSSVCLSLSVCLSVCLSLSLSLSLPTLAACVEQRSMLLYVLLGMRSPGRPPQRSHSSWALKCEVHANHWPRYISLSLSFSDPNVLAPKDLSLQHTWSGKEAQLKNSRKTKEKQRKKDIQATVHILRLLKTVCVIP